VLARDVRRRGAAEEQQSEVELVAQELQDVAGAGLAGGGQAPESGSADEGVA
jgi:hypothetical protein